MLDRPSHPGPAAMLEAIMRAMRFSYVFAALLCLALCTTRSVHAEGGYMYVTQWGTAGTGDGQFVNLKAVATDGIGDVYVADGMSSLFGTGGCRVQKFTATGGYITQWGDYLCPPGPGHFPSGTLGVAADGSGNVYVTDAGAHDNIDCFARVQKFTSTGGFVSQAPNSWYYGGQVTLDKFGNVYFLHWLQDFSLQLLVFTGDLGAPPTHAWSWQEGSGDGQFEEVQMDIGMAVDGSGNVYITDPGNSRIQEFSSAGTFVKKWGSPGTGDGQFDHPDDVTIDADGNLYVVDKGNNRIQKFTGTGNFLTKWGSPGSGNGEFSSPVGLAIDISGNIYVADYGNYRIQEFAPAPTPTRRDTWGGLKARYLSDPPSAKQSK